MKSIWLKRELFALTFLHKVGHHSGRFLPIEVGVLKFSAAYVGAKYRKKHWNEGSCTSFDICESRILMHSVPLPSLGILGADGLLMSYLIVLQLLN